MWAREASLLRQGWRTHPSSGTAKDNQQWSPATRSLTKDKSPPDWFLVLPPSLGANLALQKILLNMAGFSTNTLSFLLLVSFSRAEFLWGWGHGARQGGNKPCLSFPHTCRSQREGPIRKRMACELSGNQMAGPDNCAESPLAVSATPSRRTPPSFCIIGS